MKVKKKLENSLQMLQNITIKNQRLMLHVIKLTRLYRYYVFRRKDKVTTKAKKEVAKEATKEVNKKKTKKQKGGVLTNQLTIKDVQFNEVPELFNPTKFIKKNPTDIIDYSFMSSVHDVLKNHEIIPKSVSMMQFYTDIGFDICIDDEINEKNLTKLNKKLIIKHEVDNESSETALEGSNFIIVSKDCDKDKPVVDKYNFHKESPTMILYHDGNKFWPIYKIEKDKAIGLFENDSDVIKKL